MKTKKYKTAAHKRGYGIEVALRYSFLKDKVKIHCIYENNDKENSVPLIWAEVSVVGDNSL